MGKSNSGFGDMIVWGLGIFALTEIFGKETKEVYKYTENPTTWTFIPKSKFKDIHGNIPKDSTGRGMTGLDFKLKLEFKKNNNGIYTAKVSNFEVIVQTYLNTDPILKWKNIDKFSRYYTKNKIYKYEDVDQDNFYTKEGTDFHESLHRKVAKDSLNKYKNEIDLEISKLRGTDRLRLEMDAYKKLYEYRDKIESDFYDKKDHERIILDTWNRYKMQYEQKFINKKGIGQIG